jgi:hypothetical protein
MGTNIVLRWASAVGTSEGDLGVRYVNTSGTPIVSCVRRDLGNEFNGQIVSDVYTLTFSGTTCRISAALGAKNPWHNPTTGVTIVKDGVTENNLVIPGLTIVFSSGTGDTNSAKVTVGAYMTAGGIVTNAFNFGITANNGERAAFRVAAKNIGDRVGANASIRRLPGLYYTGSISTTHIARIGPHSSTARDQLATAGAKSMTFANWVLAGSYYTANVYIGGILCISSAIFDGSTVYEYGSGNGYSNANDGLRGLQIVFANTSVSPVGSTVVITVADGWQWVELAPDISGTAGNYQASELVLGDIDVSGVAYIWVGWSVPLGTARGSIKLWIPRVACMEV